MNILTFNKISKPIYEGGVDIDLRPRGKWFVEVRRTDGTIRYPFGDRWIDNVFINRWADGQLSGTALAANGTSWSDQGSNANCYTWLNLFYGSQSSIAVGSGTTPATQTDTALANQIRFDSTPFISGNSITFNSTTGDVVYTIKEQFPAETGSVTYNEAGIRLVGGTSVAAINGLITVGSSGLINRVVFPGSISLSAGEQLILTVAVTKKTLASTAGKTITIAAQNGVNISGVLKCIATNADLAGGTVTANGTLTRTSTYPDLFSINTAPVALLSTKTAFDTAGANPTWGTTNETTSVWSSYTNASRFRDLGFQWNQGTPVADTNFRSILFRWATTGSANGGYQLLLDNQMTKAANAVLAMNLRFTV
jgi:hypothetical protein